MVPLIVGAVVLCILVGSLGILLIPDVGKVELLKRTLYGGGGAITAATNASPTVVTSAAHGLSNGNAITISDVGGNTNCNGTWIVGNVTANTFELYPTSQGTGGTPVNANAAYTSGGEWCLAGMENWSLKLFKSNTTPAESDTAGTYTEANFTGYSAITLNSTQVTTTAATWQVPTSVLPTNSWAPGAQTHVAESTYAQQTFTCSGNTTTNTVYGYFIVGSSSTVLYCAETFTLSVNMFLNNTIQMTPRFGCANAS